MRMNLAPLRDLKACVFDAYGTLFDFASAAKRCEAELGDSFKALTIIWRDKQLQYSWLLAAQGRHMNFYILTGDALDSALETLAIRKSGQRERPMGLYLTFDVFPEAPDVLRRLKSAGLRLAILSNGTPAMLNSAVAGAGLDGVFEAVLSVEEVGVFKPIQEFVNWRWSGFNYRRARSRSNRRTLGTRMPRRHSACRWFGVTATASHPNAFRAIQIARFRRSRLCRRYLAFRSLEAVPPPDLPELLSGIRCSSSNDQLGNAARLARGARSSNASAPSAAERISTSSSVGYHDCSAHREASRHLDPPHPVTNSFARTN